MGTFNIGPRLRMFGGVRYEHYNMDYKANFVYVTHSVDGVCLLFDTLNTVNRNDDDLLPNAQLRYSSYRLGRFEISLHTVSLPSGLSSDHAEYVL